MEIPENKEEKPVGVKTGSEKMANQEVELKKLVKRIGDTGDFIKYNAGACNGCGICSKLCPMNIWGIKDGKAVLASDYNGRCVECGSCDVACPTGAINFSYPKGGTGVIWEYG